MATGTVPPTSQIAVRPREAREEGLLRAIAVRFAHRELVGRARAEDAEILGQHDEPRALALPPRRSAAPPAARLAADVAAGDRLHGGHAERRRRHRRVGAVRHGIAFISRRSRRAPGVALAVADAPRVTIGSDQLPVTVYS